MPEALPLGTLQLELQHSGVVRVTEGLQLLGPGENLGVPPALLHKCLLCSLPWDRAGKWVPAVAEPRSFAELHSQTTCGGSSVVPDTTKHLQVCSLHAAVTQSRTGGNGAGAPGLIRAAETTCEPLETPGKGCPARAGVGDTRRCQPWSRLCSILCKKLLFWCRICVGQRLCHTSEPCCGLVGYHWV